MGGGGAVNLLTAGSRAVRMQSLALVYTDRAPRGYLDCLVLET